MPGAKPICGSPPAISRGIADHKKELANALGIVAPEGVAFRATFIVDPDNVIQHVTVNGLNVGRNPAETLRVLDMPSAIHSWKSLFQTQRAVTYELLLNTDHGGYG